MTITAEINDVTTSLKVEPYEGPTAEERGNAIQYYQHPKQIHAYLERCGVRRRLRKESHRVDSALIPPECHDWLAKCRQGASMILCGPPGSGKSTAAVWCLRRLWLEGELVVPEDHPEKPSWSTPEAHYAKVGELYDAVFERDLETIRRIERVPVLVLDDWGVDYEHAWPLTRLDRLIDNRWDEALPTIVTTNMQPTQLNDSLPRAYDRLTGWPGPGVVELDRESLRQR